MHPLNNLDSRRSRNQYNNNPVGMIDLLPFTTFLSALSLASLIRQAEVEALKPRSVRYQTGYLTTIVDHFAIRGSQNNTKSHTNATFQLKYLHNYDWYRSGGPIFFHCGGQG